MHNTTNRSDSAAHVIPIAIPDSHLDLIDGCYNVVLTTVMPDGQPQSTPVWCNRQGGYVLINTMRGFRKEKNMRANPAVTLLAYDPGNPLHNVEIRGEVAEMTQDGAREHLDQLTRKYMRQPDARFFGDCVAADLQTVFTPVKITIAPTRVRVEG
jgi:PPOX class probable F420-dependent enzyme